MIEGEGVFEAGESRIEFGKFDSFVAPNWTTTRFVNRSSKNAILFSVEDTPVLRALGMYREARIG